MRFDIACGGWPCVRQNRSSGNDRFRDGNHIQILPRIDKKTEGFLDIQVQFLLGQKTQKIDVVSQVQVGY